MKRIKPWAILTLIILGAVIGAFVTTQVQAKLEQKNQIQQRIQTIQSELEKDPNTVAVDGCIIVRKFGSSLQASYDQQLYTLFGYPDGDQNPQPLINACRKWAKTNNYQAEFDGPPPTMACKNPVVYMKLLPKK